jgi:hypothetical protein
MKSAIEAHLPEECLAKQNRTIDDLWMRYAQAYIFEISFPSTRSKSERYRRAVKLRTDSIRLETFNLIDRRPGILLLHLQFGLIRCNESANVVRHVQQP